MRHVALRFSLGGENGAGHCAGRCRRHCFRETRDPALGGPHDVVEIRRSLDDSVGCAAHRLTVVLGRCFINVLVILRAAKNPFAAHSLWGEELPSIPVPVAK